MGTMTLSLDEKVLNAGREYARHHSMSFDALVKKLIEQTVTPNKEQWLEDTFALMDTLDVSTENQQWTREELYRVESLH